MKPLFIPLKTQFFDAFKDGSKRYEYRVYGYRWNERTCTVGRPVVLSRGYGKQARLNGAVKSFRVLDNANGLAGWAECYGNTNVLVAVIEIEVQP